MPGKTKEGETDERSERDDAEDLNEHAYYYDDAHGYEEFDPEIADEDGDEEDQPAAGR